MRPSWSPTALAFLFLSAAGISTAFAGETKPSPLAPDPYDELNLPVAAVAETVWPWSPEIRACWLRHATRPARQDGNLRIEVIVDPSGMVWRHGLVYRGARSRALERCLDGVIAQLRFPMRRGYTHAAIPFLFRAGAKPGTGPFMSCWKPRGCPRPRPSIDPGDR